MATPDDFIPPQDKQTAPHDQAAGGEELRRQLAGFLRIARKHRNDLDMLPILRDLVTYVEAERTAARQQVVDEIRGKIEAKRIDDFQDASYEYNNIVFTDDVRAILDEARGEK